MFSGEPKAIPMPRYSSFYFNELRETPAEKFPVLVQTATPGAPKWRFRSRFGSLKMTAEST
jgi:hypothetical protein